MGQLGSLGGCVVLSLLCSKKRMKLGILGQFICTVAYLVMGFVNESSAKEPQFLELNIIFCFSQSIVLMILLLRSREAERELLFENWIRVGPLQRSAHYSSILTKPLRDSPMNKSSRGIE